ncbi:MAG: thiamine phosphate synthase, partial [Pseudomonadota bacterium]|nr:thiamine phosphate synthase [Pseudomonadota bacterium]
MGLKHQAAVARKWRSAIRQIDRHFPEHLPPLLFLTDPDRTPEPDPVIAALPVGSGLIYRHFGVADRREVAARLRVVCRARGIAFLIAADPVLACEMQADGVHWPEARLLDARRWRGQFFIQTTSAHSRKAIQNAADAGMDAQAARHVAVAVQTPLATDPAALRQHVVQRGETAYRIAT